MYITLNEEQLEILCNALRFINNLGREMFEARLYDTNPAKALLDQTNHAGGEMALCLSLNGTTDRVCINDEGDEIKLMWKIVNGKFYLYVIGFGIFSFESFNQEIEQYLDEEGVWG